MEFIISEIILVEINGTLHEAEVLTVYKYSLDVYIFSTGIRRSVNIERCQHN